MSPLPQPHRVVVDLSDPAQCGCHSNDVGRARRAPSSAATPCLSAKGPAEAPLAVPDPRGQTDRPDTTHRVQEQLHQGHPKQWSPRARKSDHPSPIQHRSQSASSHHRTAPNRIFETPVSTDVRAKAPAPAETLALDWPDDLCVSVPATSSIGLDPTSMHAARLAPDHALMRP